MKVHPYPPIYLSAPPLEEPLPIDSAAPIEDLLISDFWDFGSAWDEVKERYQTLGSLYEAIRDKVSLIFRIRERARSRIKPNEQLRKLASEVRENGTCVIPADQMVRIDKGISGSYALYDKEGAPRFIVKPLDEEAGCLHNPKGLATPFDSSQLRNHLPLYFSSFRDASVWEIAEMIGVGSITPKTTLAILESDSFSDFSERVSLSEIHRLIDQVGPGSREKLCSIQEFIPDAQSLFTSLQELQIMDLSDAEIAKRFDPRDFEDANILLWTTYDLDGHSGNFLCYPKGSDAFGNEILGIKKIDNGMAFPDRNRGFHNHLKYLPSIHSSLSEEGRTKILAIDVESLAATLKKNHLDSAIPAFLKRMAELKKIALTPGITLKEINNAMGGN